MKVIQYKRSIMWSAEICYDITELTHHKNQDHTTSTTTAKYASFYVPDSGENH